MGQKKKADCVTAGVNISARQTRVERDVAGRDITYNYNYATNAATALAPHHLPPPPRDFTGRKEELDELRAAIEKGGLTITGLQGLGGVGKTALALKLADELKLRYPDAQFYVDLKGVSKEPMHPKDAMGYVIRSCHPDVRLPENEAELAGLYQSVLHNKRAILLMDNAKDEKQVEPLIPPVSCLFLVTSRQHFTLAGLDAKNLDALSPADARSLILSIAKRLAKEQRDYASKLAGLCGYLPLAIRSVAKVLAARIDLNPANYVRKLADARERLQLTEADASLGLSYDLLTTKLQKQFRTLAVFPGTFDVEAAAAVWGLDSESARSSLSDLSLYSLVEYNSATNRYRLHDLVRAFADTRLNSNERMASQKRHASHYKNVLDEADKLYLKGGKSLKAGLALFDAEWGNVQAGHAWAAEHAGEDGQTDELLATYILAGAHKRLRDHSRAVAHYIQKLQIARDKGDRSGEAIVHWNMSLALDQLGERAKAIMYAEAALKILDQIEDPDAATVRKQLAEWRAEASVVRSEE